MMSDAIVLTALQNMMIPNILHLNVNNLLSKTNETNSLEKNRILRQLESVSPN